MRQTLNCCWYIHAHSQRHTHTHAHTSHHVCSWWWHTHTHTQHTHTHIHNTHTHTHTHTQTHTWQIHTQHTHTTHTRNTRTHHTTCSASRSADSSFSTYKILSYSACWQKKNVQVLIIQRLLTICGGGNKKKNKILSYSASWRFETKKKSQKCTKSYHTAPTGNTRSCILKQKKTCARSYHTAPVDDSKQKKITKNVQDLIIQRLLTIQTKKKRDMRDKKNRETDKEQEREMRRG